LKKNPKFENIIVEKAKSSSLPVLTRYLGIFDKNGMNFLKKCLEIDPEKRMTVEQALRHPYLAKYV